MTRAGGLTAVKNNRTGRWPAPFDVFGWAWMAECGKNEREDAEGEDGGRSVKVGDNLLQRVLGPHFG